jgi:hypothetical protein
MRTLTALLLLAPVAWAGETDTLPRAPCEVRPTALDPPPPTTTALPRGAGTGIPPLDDLLREAKRQGTPVVQQFNEDGVGLVWFKATPDGWLSKVPAPVQARPALPVVQQPRREVAAPQASFRNRTTFVAGSEWGKHSCPVCGAQRWEIDGWAGNGEHFHACPNANCVDANGQHTYWRH